MGLPVSRRVPEGVSVDTSTYIPQNDPRNALIILNVHKWGKFFFTKHCPSTEARVSIFEHAAALGLWAVGLLRHTAALLGGTGQ